MMGKTSKEGDSMFVTVKALTSCMDDMLYYYKDGTESKDRHEPEEYNKWHESITRKLNFQLKELKRISSNQKLIEKYEKIINNLTK